MDDQYFTIAKEATAELKIKNSRFIGETCLVESVEQATEQLQIIRKREHSATHHCYAYQVGLFGQTQFKYSDDGEPSGTAGKPIYDQLTGSGLSNLLIVVTRYYGGTQLGTGGLTHAYSETAQAVLEVSGRKEHFLQTEFDLQIEFPLYDRVQRLVAKLGASIINADFSDQVKLRLAIRKSRAEELYNHLVELSNGKAIIDQR